LNKCQRNYLRKAIGNRPNEINFASINDLLDIDFEAVKGIKSRKKRKRMCRCFKEDQMNFLDDQ